MMARVDCAGACPSEVARVVASVVDELVVVVMLLVVVGLAVELYRIRVAEPLIMKSEMDQ